MGEFVKDKKGSCTYIRGSITMYSYKSGLDFYHGTSRRNEAPIQTHKR